MTPVADVRSALTTWERSGETSARGTVRLPASLPVFAGHFPGAPLVPGVYVLATLAEVAARAGIGAQVVAVERAKWSAPAYPDQDLVATVAWKSVEGGWQLDGEVANPAGVCATCRLIVR